MTDTTLALALLDAALRGGAIALLLLVALRIVRGGEGESSSTSTTPRARRLARLLTAFSLALCVQIATSTPLFERGLPPEWQAIFVGISVGNSVLFWLFAQHLFDDDFELRNWHAAPWLFMFASGVTFCLSFGEGELTAAVHRIARGLIRWLPLLFAALAMVATIRHWSADLVESRRRLRAIVVVGGIVYTVAMVVLRIQARGGMLTGPAALADIGFMLAIVAVSTASVVRLQPGELLSPVRVRAAVPVSVLPDDASSSVAQPATATVSTTDAQEQQLLAHLAALMDGQRAYAQENLSLASLAQQLGVPEYRLRRAINGALGHRNFNAYVNEFRLREAQAALRDPAKRELPILTIALTAGFQSIGPFNRAFKAQTGRTPTEYRQAAFAPPDG